MRALAVVGEEVLEPLRKAALQGRQAFGPAFFAAVAADPALWGARSCAHAPR